MRPFPGRLGDDRRRIGRASHEHDRAAIARAARASGTSASSREQLLVVRVLVGHRARVARGVDARAAAERVHLDAGIVGDRGKPRDAPPHGAP